MEVLARVTHRRRSSSLSDTSLLLPCALRIRRASRSGKPVDFFVGDDVGMVIATPFVGFGWFVGVMRVEYTVVEHPKIEQLSKDALHGQRTRLSTDAQLPSGENATRLSNEHGAAAR